MKSILFTIVFISTMVANGQEIYIKTFGKSTNKPIIFLHGGPGYNCANFEATTAQKLADKGFFVIAYDRRGEGRSKDPKATFTFRETFDDLNSIYEKYGLSKSILIGHSFGGIVATIFATSNENKVQSVILVGAPVSLQTTFKTIISKSKAIYQSKNDSTNLKYLSLLENMDSSSIEYSSYSFQHAMKNGFYTPANATSEAKTIYAAFRTDSLLKKYASQMTIQASQGFWKNEKYTTIDLAKNLDNLKVKNINIYGLYGKEDGLYSAQQITDLEKQIGTNNLKYFDRCSHNVFIDQQAAFIESVYMWAK